MYISPNVSGLKQFRFSQKPPNIVLGFECVSFTFQVMMCNYYVHILYILDFLWIYVQVIHGLLDRVMQLLDVKFTEDGSGYHIKMCDGERTRE